MSKEQMARDVVSAVEAMREELLGLSHAIHAAPELALEEVQAAAGLTGAVEGHGIGVTREAFGLPTGFAAEFGRGGDDSPTVAILSEFDALPGIGHACGHNVIAAAGLGAALALSKLNGRLPGRVRYLGTPAEERFGGKEFMARAGAFERVDAAMMIHPAAHDLVTMRALACTDVEVTYFGRTAHASAAPHMGLNALDAVVSAYQAIAQLRQHIRASEKIHGIITEGGLAPNIVPERAACRFMVRAPDAEALAALKRRVEACFEAGALASGCRMEAKWGATDYLDLKTNWPMAASFERHAAGLGRAFFPMENLPAGQAASTDMGNVSHRVPSIHPILAVAPVGVPNHTPEFTRWAASPRGDQAVIDGAKAMALTALDLMGDPALMTAVRGDFAATSEESLRALGTLQAHAGGCGCGCG